MRFSSAALVGGFAAAASAIELDINSDQSIRDAANLLAGGVMDYYTGDRYGQPIGMFSNPYYWWEAGAAWSTMIDYTFIFENDTYTDTIIEAMQYQVGEAKDYVPANQSTTEGNDDQAFWGIAALEACERNFTNPPEKDPQWLYLAQAVFNTMALRWDSAHCGGGLRWQIFQWNSGYDYKNSVSNGALFHIAARLARYVQDNQSYVDWAEKSYNWMVDVGFISQGEWWFVYDGAEIDNNCSDVVEHQWTYNQGLLLAGCAYLYNFTQDEKWLTRAENFLESSQVFFNNSILYEAACQGAGSCNNDQRAFRAIFAKFLGLTVRMIPSFNDTIMNWIESSAIAACKSCDGGRDGHTCGQNWFLGTYDNMYGLGEELSALEVVQNLMIWKRPAPYTSKDGGSSVGDGAAGTYPVQKKPLPLDLDTGDVVGASIITVVVGVVLIAGTLWLLL